MTIDYATGEPNALITFTRDEAHRARNAARRRHLAAQSYHNSWARVIAVSAARGEQVYAATFDNLILARAAEFEAREDWLDARELCGFERPS